MRFSSLTVMMTAFLVAGAANAAEGPKGAGDTGKGGPSPGGTSSGGGEAAASTGVESGGTRNENPDVADAVTTAYKPWEVGVIFTTHRLLIQGDQNAGMPDPAGEPGSGNGVNKQVNDYEMYARYDLTKNDRVGVRAYVFEYFLADTGENGVRFDDMVVTYAHTFKLPQKFRLQASLWGIIPTSYSSQLEGLMLGIRPGVEVDRRFGPVSVSVRASDTVYIQKYDSWAGDEGGSAAAGGAAPTTLNSLAFASDVEFHMPFHEPLSTGIGAFVGYSWYNNIQSDQGSKGQLTPVSDANFPGQPIQETYGWEAYVRYLLPDLFGFKSDLTAAYSFGDPTVGYSSLLQDGVGHVFLGYRHNSEVYLSMAVRY